MRPALHPRLINGPFDDPGLLVHLAFRKQALLFDLGDLSALSPGDILKIDTVFVTHTHMDHFIGFDQMLRLLLGRGKRLRLFGPRGFRANLVGRLRGYTWNLLHHYTDALVIEANEIDGSWQTTQTYDARNGFAPSSPLTVPISPDGVLYQSDEQSLCVRTVILDHQVPCLAYSLQERFHVNILKQRLVEMALPVGPWLNHFKGLLYQHAAPETPVNIPADARHPKERRFTLGELAHKIVRIGRGQKIAYVCDAVYHPENEEKIITLAREADHLFIEAAFLHSEKSIARAKHHLTAHQAGIMARKANVARMTLFHHSPRYAGHAHQLEAEAMAAFKNRCL